MIVIWSDKDLIVPNSAIIIMYLIENKIGFNIQLKNCKIIEKQGQQVMQPTKVLDPKIAQRKGDTKSKDQSFKNL